MESISRGKVDPGCIWAPMGMRRRRWEPLAAAGKAISFSLPLFLLRKILHHGLGQLVFAVVIQYHPSRSIHNNLTSDLLGLGLLKPWGCCRWRGHACGRFRRP